MNNENISVNTAENLSQNLSDNLPKNLTAYSRNRELSWLNFNRRVLEEAIDPETPRFEALKFVAIFTSNLEEYFRVRVGSLTDLAYVDQGPADTKTGMTAQEQLDAIYAQVKEDLLLKDNIYESVMSHLNSYGIHDLTYAELNKEEKKQVEAYYKSMIEPILTPQIIDSHHPFPFIPNNHPHIILEMNNEGEKTFGLVPIPDNVKDYFLIKREKLCYIRSENIIKEFSPKLFGSNVIENVSVINVIRNADIDTDDYLADHDIDYRAFMKDILKKRKRLQAVAVHSNGELGKKLRAFLCENLSIKDEQIMSTSSPLVMGYVFAMEDVVKEKGLEALLYKPFSPQANSEVNPQRSMIDQALEKDLLYIYPFETVDDYIRLLEEAAEDPRVISIRITIYRLAKNSRIARALARAAENGKEVTALMELQARFDEASNINYSEILQEAGCIVSYGVPGFKVHSKITLITLKDKDKIRHITQIGTGNYNEKTAKMYTDLSYITAHKGIGQDGVNFFQNMAITNVKGEYKHLRVSPVSFKPTILDLIDQEIAKGPEEGEIFFKFNSFTDKDLLIKLSEASNAGLKVRLMIRGISCLLPGLEGYTENIESRSIVGRYLEHPRIYKFGKGKDAKVLIGSADLMTRNTERRVEIAAPIYDSRLKDKIFNYLDSQWQDNYKSRLMGTDGNFVPLKRDPQEEIYIHQYKMMEDAILQSEIASVRKQESEQEKGKGLLDKISDFFKKIFG